MVDRRTLLRHAAGGVAAAGLAASGGQASDGKAGPVTIADSERFDLAASDGRVYRISIALPGAGKGPFPVAFLLDAELLFGLTTDLVRALAGFGTIAPTILVGVGYPTQDPSEFVARRLDDFTFVPDEAHAALVRRLIGPRYPVRTGGGAAFLDFIETRLKPEIARRYAADLAAPALLGHSLGGLFALHALFHPSAPFARYAVTSPPILWAHEAILAEEARHAAAHPDLKARLYLAAGSEETDLAHVLGLPAEMKPLERDFAAAMGNPDPLEQLRRFHTALASRAYPGLREEFQIFDGESHASVPAPAFARALPLLFAPEVRP